MPLGLNQQVYVVSQAGFLQIEGVKFGDAVVKPNGMVGRQPAMHLNEQVNIGTNRFANGLNVCTAVLFFSGQDIAPGGAHERVPLHGGKSMDLTRSALSAMPRWRITPPKIHIIPPVGIHPDALARLSASRL